MLVIEIIYPFTKLFILKTFLSRFSLKADVLERHSHDMRRQVYRKGLNKFMYYISHTVEPRYKDHSKLTLTMLKFLIGIIHHTYLDLSIIIFGISR